jgi:glycerol uptake facilitator-like aquaporin
VVSKLTAEFLGTFWLVLGGCGSAVLAAAFPDVGIGLLGVSLAFGLTVLSGAYALGPISGGHFNPAVSVGLWAGGRFPSRLLLPYAVAQVVGGAAGAGVAIAGFLHKALLESPIPEPPVTGRATSGALAGQPLVSSGFGQGQHAHHGPP